MSYFLVSLSFSSLSAFLKLFIYFSSHSIMANLRNELVNMTPELNSVESLSLIEFENPYLIDILYGMDPPIHAQNVPNGSSEPGLDSLDDTNDLIVRETIDRDVYPASTYFNMGISIYRETECETSASFSHSGW